MQRKHSIVFNFASNFLYLARGRFSIEKGGYTGVGQFSRGHHETLNMKLFE